MTEELEASIAADAGDVHPAIDWETAIKRVTPLRGTSFRIDGVLDWFKQTGGGYHSHIYEVLRAFVESRRTLR